MSRARRGTGEQDGEASLECERPGYREGTAHYPCRFQAAGREAAKEAERSDFLIPY